MGLGAHKLRDVVPHQELPNDYIDPPRSSTLQSRSFPDKDPQGRILAEQDTLADFLAPVVKALGSAAAKASSEVLRGVARTVRPR
jgi:hypothetical protein